MTTVSTTTGDALQNLDSCLEELFREAKARSLNAQQALLSANGNASDAMKAEAKTASIELAFLRRANIVPLELNLIPWSMLPEEVQGQTMELALPTIGICIAQA